MDGITDFHSHILPEMDDGSRSVEESIALLKMEAEQGVTHVVATPHFYARYDSPERFLRRRERSEQMLRQAMAQCQGLPKLTVGAEVYFFRGMSESEFLPQLTIGDKRCILIEMAHSPWTEDMYRELEAIWDKRGMIPIIAHVDRYIAPFRTHGIPDRLARLPVFVQANGEFFLERSTAGMAMRMLKRDQIQLLGSDCHNLTDRKPNLADAFARIRQKLGPEAVDRIREYERKLLGCDPDNEK